MRTGWGGRRAGVDSDAGCCERRVDTAHCYRAAVYGVEGCGGIGRGPGAAAAVARDEGDAVGGDGHCGDY